MTRRVLSISLSGLLAFVATFVASAPWWRAFPVATLVPLLLGAAAISVVLPPLVALGLRRSATISIVLSIVVFLVYALGVTLQDIGSFDMLLRGFTQGLARLLSVALPVSQPRWLYVAPVALTWLTGAATSELLTRDTGSGVAALFWAASFALAFSVTAGAPGNDVGWAVVLVVVAGFLVALRRYLPDLFGTTVDPDSTEGAPGGRRLRARPLAFGAASLAAAALIGIFAIPAVPALKAQPVTPARQPPVSASTPLTPTATMVELRNLTPRQPSPLFDFSANRPTSGYVSLAGLDAYDGSIWSFTRTFHPTGGRVPPAVGAFADLRQPLATGHYKILRTLDFPWMPYVDRPANVTGLPAGFGFDALTGMIVPESALTAGATYTVVSQPTAVTLATLGAGQLNLGFVASPDPADTLVPVDEQASLSGVIKILQRQTGATAAVPLTFLHAVAEEFRTQYRRLAPSMANDTTFADAVNAVVTNHKATPEEFATVFALIARQLGVPARLVTGFRLAGPGSTPAPTVPGKTYTVTSADAWTWVELPVNGLGWVVADPTPSKTGTPVVPTAAPRAASTTTTSPQIRSASHPQTSVRKTAKPTVFPKTHNTADNTGLFAALAGVVVLLAALPAGIILPTLRRRRRRRRLTDPTLRVTAAWLEALDTLDEADLQDLGPLTNREVVERTRERFGDGAAGHALAVAERASAATFSSRPLIDRAQAESTWSELDALRRAVSEALPFRLRLRATFAIARQQQRARSPRR